MYNLTSIYWTKKLFLFVVILIFITGCSSTKSLFGPSDGGDDSSMVNDQLDEEFGGEDIGDILDDFEEQVQEDINEFDGKINEDNMRDALDDFKEQIEKDFDDLDTKIDDQDMQSNLDDFEVQLEKDLDELDDKIEDHFMKDVIRDFEKKVEEDLVDDKLKEERRGGSCDMIAKTSTCIDYIGSFWTETQMKYSCSYSGTFSFDSCKTGSIGGCNVGKGGFNDMIIWMYSYGGSPISSDTVKSAKPACDMNPMGTWVNAK